VEAVEDEVERERELGVVIASTPSSRASLRMLIAPRPSRSASPTAAATTRCLVS